MRASKALSKYNIGVLPRIRQSKNKDTGVREIHWDITGTLQGWTGEARILSEPLFRIHPLRRFSFCELLKKTHLKYFFFLPVRKKINLINNNRKLSRKKKTKEKKKGKKRPQNHEQAAVASCN